MKIEIEVPIDDIKTLCRLAIRDQLCRDRRGSYDQNAMDGKIREAVKLALLDLDLTDLVAAEIKRSLPVLVKEVAQDELRKALAREMSKLRKAANNAAVASQSSLFQEEAE